MKKFWSLVLVFALALTLAAPIALPAVAEEKPQHEISFLVKESHRAEYLKNGIDDYAAYPTWQALTALLDEAGISLSFELIGAEQYEVVIQTRMASASNLPDVVEASPLGAAGIISIAEYGVVQDLIPLINQYSNGNIMNFYEKGFPFAKALSMTPDGKMYWFCSMYQKQYEGAASPTGVAFSMRQDWLDKVGMQAPATIDQFYDALVAFREQDANGNGQADEIVNFDFSLFGTTIPQMFGLGSSVISVDVAEKKAVSPWLQDGIKPYIAFVQKMIAAGVVDPALVGSVEIASQRMAENRVSASATWVTVAETSLLTNVVAEGAQAVTLDPINATENAPLYVYAEEPQGVFNYFVVTNQCKDPEGVIKFFDTVYTDAYADLTMYGVKDVTYTVQDGVKLLYENINQWTVDEVFEQKAVNGVHLWNNVLPRVQYMDLRRELIGITKRAAQVSVDMAQVEHWYPMYQDAIMAMPTAEETERINELLGGVTTYSEELITKLCLGQLPVEDWDAYMEEFDKLGLNELIGIYQARVDRYFASMGA